MKKMTVVFLLLCLLLSSVGIASAYQYSNWMNWSTDVWFKANESLATRTGPNTAYTGGGSYNNVKGQSFQILARAEGNGVTWLYIELNTSGYHRRVWSGSKRFATYQQQFRSLPWYTRWNYSGTITQQTTCYWGPSTWYDSYSSPLSRGTRVTVVGEENGYCCIEYNTRDGVLCCYVPSDCVSY